MKAFFLSLISIFMTAVFPAEGISSVSGNSPMKILRTVDEDLETFHFNWEKYKVDPSRVYQPILMNYLESNTADYCDLIYFYDPNDFFTVQAISGVVLMGDSLDNLQGMKNVYYNLYFAGTSEDGTIKRYGIMGYSAYRAENAYRRYNFDHLKYNDRTIEIENNYLFQGNEQDFSNCMNLVLGDPHAWSWHFDEDTWSENAWESILSFFGWKSDVLRDQIFYSFYVENWEVSQIRSIDIKYKKVLLEGYRHNEADTGISSEFFKGTTGTRFDPQYYAWNDNNTKDNVDTSVLLGNSLAEIGPNIEDTKITIVPEDRFSVGIGHNYKWNTIQNKKAFADAFGTASDIYQFASGYFQEDRDDYWVINFDDFYYSYAKVSETYGDSNWMYHSEYMPEDFYKYCKEYNCEQTVSSGPPGPNGNTTLFYNYEVYRFTQEYVFDVRATQMTFEDTASVSYTLPVSVAPVDEEASGGFSEYPLSFHPDFSRFIKVVMILLIVIGIILLLNLIDIFIPKKKKVIVQEHKKTKKRKKK